MRNYLLLAPAIPLAACGGGGGIQTVGGSAPPAGTPTPTPTPTPTAASFVNPVEAKTYAGLGAVEHYTYTTRSDGNAQSGELYAGDANTVRDSGISITYDPRDAIFDITISRPKGLVNATDLRFQDPLHRTAFGGLKEPQAGVPNLDAAKQIQYLESGSGSGQIISGGNNGNYITGADGYSSTTQTFFYQKPGTTTKYVTYAGFVRNTLSVGKQTDVGATVSHLQNTYSLDRAAFVYGELTANSAVPKSGTATYSGDMLATMVYNPLPDTDPTAATYFQWIDGSQTTVVDFGTLKVTTNLTGTVRAPTLDAYTTHAFSMPNGSTFTASATSLIDLVGKGGFTGSFTSACFAATCTAGNSLLIAGSSLDGAFYGPNGEEIGAGFRVVGGTPDQRIDILGTFTGHK
jgi:hypothetical protein